MLKDKSILTDHFTVEQLTFAGKGDKGKSELEKKPSVVGKDIPGLIEFMNEERGLTGV